jgi:hypothetical protein
MSQLLQVATRSGAVATLDGGGAPSRVDQGIPYDGLSVAADLSGVVDHHHQGLPFTAVGRLAVTSSPPLYYGSGAAPMSNGRLCMVDSSIDHYSAGIPYTSAGLVATTGLDPNGVVITTQPEDWFGLENATAIFTYTAVSGDLSLITYIWEEETAPGVWTLVVDGGQISGATTDTLSIATVTLANDQGRIFRGTATNDTNSQTTVSVSINITGGTFFIIAENGDQIITQVGTTEPTVTEDSV